MDKKIIKWLLEGDAAIEYQTRRDLLDTPERDLKILKDRISKEGYGKRFLEKQNDGGHWGQLFYQPKWISTHYTLLDLKNLNVNKTAGIERALSIILNENKGKDGGIDPNRSDNPSDVCITGMFLNYACYFGVPEEGLNSVVDFVLSQVLLDGGFNCRLNRSGAHHSSVHSTISLLEGITEYEKNGFVYRLEDLLKVKASSIEFLLMHKLYKSDKTGEIIHKRMTTLPYPSRWKYDILRALDYFQHEGVPYDLRMEDALDLLISKRKQSGKWTVQAKYPGQVHFEMEKAGKESRWNTLRALRVLRFYDKI